MRRGVDCHEGKGVKSNFDECLKKLLVHEGGYVNHPSDPGGMTNLGVTARVWEEWTHHPATEEVMRKLTPADVAPLYKRKYWDAVHGDELPDGVDHCVFDSAVNMGIGRAVKLLQQVMGLHPDGGLGPITLSAVQAHDPKKLVAAYCDVREEFYKSLPTYGTFGKGWMNRVAAVETEASNMVG